jgi:CheY-like chemotaxis protein
VGTSCELYFPATRTGLPLESSPVSPAEIMGNGERVLIVDDIEEQREIAAHMLTELGYAVTAVPSGEEALAYLQTAAADILVLDMIMGTGMDGLETYRRILEFRPGQRAIIASGFSETRRVKQTQALGAGAYVQKPYTLEKIGLAIKNELKKTAA